MPIKNQNWVSYAIFTLLYFLKDILRYSNHYQLMNFIYILLIIERNKDAKLITMTLSQFIDPLTINLTEELPPEIDALYQHYSDMIYLYYISYLNKLEKNETTKEFKKLLKLLFSKPNNDRDIIFADNLKTIFNHQEKRSNINKSLIIGEIAK